jgi:hypothetical protein
MPKGILNSPCFALDLINLVKIANQPKRRRRRAVLLLLLAPANDANGVQANLRGFVAMGVDARVVVHEVVVDHLMGTAVVESCDYSAGE